MEMTTRTRALWLLLMGRPDAEGADQGTAAEEPAPALLVTDEPGGLQVGMVPRDATPEQQAAAMAAFAEALAEVVREHLSDLGVSVRVIPPAEGHAGLVQYLYPSAQGSELEARMWWREIAALLPEAERRTNYRLSVDHLLAQESRQATRAPAAPTPRRASAPACRGR